MTIMNIETYQHFINLLSILPIPFLILSIWIISRIRLPKSKREELKNNLFNPK